MNREEIERKLKKLKESNRKISIRCFVGAKFKNGLSGERYTGVISGVNLKWYFDKQYNIISLSLDKNVVKAYGCEISVSLHWNEIKVCYWKLVNN